MAAKHDIRALDHHGSGSASSTRIVPRVNPLLCPPEMKLMFTPKPMMTPVHFTRVPAFNCFHAPAFSGRQVIAKLNEGWAPVRLPLPPGVNSSPSFPASTKRTARSFVLNRSSSENVACQVTFWPRKGSSAFFIASPVTCSGFSPMSGRLKPGVCASGRGTLPVRSLISWMKAPASVRHWFPTDAR